MVEDMTDHDFYIEVRKGLLIIMGAMVRRFGAAYLDFLPKHVTAPAPVYSPAISTPAPEYRG
jgi:hypothetical protein